MDRRQILQRMAALGLLAPSRLFAQSMPFAASPPLVPIHASLDRLIKVTVCLRPFRAAGPRIEVEQVGRKRVVHHYGHGGSGWSLSWGSAQEAVPLALMGGERNIAVMGAGAIGLTTAITAQRLGANVTIYSKDRYPFVPSGYATGTWSPDSRLAMRSHVDADFPARWERMARTSFATYQRFVGLPGVPVEWTDRYELFDNLPPRPKPDVGMVGYSDRIRDITPASEIMPTGSYPFSVPLAQRTLSLTFNVADLVDQLESEFLAAGGRFVAREFHDPADIANLSENVVVNCTGYGARALWRDNTVVPMRGQIAWLPPQSGATYGVHYRQLYLLARRDGIVLFHHGLDDLYGFDDHNETPDLDAAKRAIAEAAALFPALAAAPQA